MVHPVKTKGSAAVLTKTAAKKSRGVVSLLVPLSTLPLWIGTAYATQDTTPQQATSFDNDFLKASGLDPKLADYFQQAPRFMPGTARVTLSVNGRKIGRVPARFDAQGELCFTSAFLKRAGLVEPSAWHSGDWSRAGADAASGTETDIDTSASPLPRESGALPSQTPACRDYRAVYPGTVVQLRPQESAVDLLVPTNALRFDDGVPKDFTTGGTAGMLNYDVFATRNTYAGGENHYAQASTEIGLNVRDWVIRSRQIVSHQNGSTQWSHVYAYAQHTFPKYRMVFQAGQIDVAGSILPVPSLYGAQIFPEAALYDPVRSGPLIEGVAQTQARIEVRQNGALIYSTAVPAGPFALRDVPVANQGADLDVTVIEATGARQHFVVPAAAFAGANLLGRPGYSFAVGKVRNSGGAAQQAPWVVTGSRNWAPNWRTGLSLGVLSATGYHSLGGGVSWRAPWRTQVSMTAVASHAGREGVNGVRTTTSLGTQLPGGVSLNLSATQQTTGYRDLIEATWASFRLGDGTSPTTGQPVRFKGQYTAAMGWSHPRIGSVSAGYSAATLHHYHGTTQRLTMSWGKTFGQTSVSLNVQRAIGGSALSRNNDNAIYLNLNIPLGKRSVGAYANRTNDQLRVGANFSDTINDNVNYGLSADTDMPWRDANFNGNLNWRTPYTQIGAGYGRYGARSNTFSVSLRGSAVAHRHGVTPSPDTVDDTFGVISMGGLPNVKVQTPSGMVTTNAWGQAVIPRMASYQVSNVQVMTHTLPRNVSIDNGLYTTKVGRGAVPSIDFSVARVRRLLLTASQPDGSLLPEGSSIVDREGQYVTAAGSEGLVFLPDSNENTALYALLPDQQRCRLDYRLSDTPDNNSPYESIKAICQPESGSLSE